MAKAKATNKRAPTAKRSASVGTPAKAGRSRRRADAAKAATDAPTPAAVATPGIGTPAAATTAPVATPPAAATPAAAVTGGAAATQRATASPGAAATGAAAVPPAAPATPAALAPGAAFTPAAAPAAGPTAKPAATPKAGGAAKAAARDERRFLELVKNHGEMRRLLADLAMVQDMHVLRQHVAAVAGCWLRLGEEHLVEARACANAGLGRATFSRSYYAAYNASKAVRFVVNGLVSLRGDDHRAVSELPDKFPNVDTWAARLPEMYRHRLLADYDNWRDSIAERTLAEQDMVRSAEDFIGDCRKYLKDAYGVTP